MRRTMLATAVKRRTRRSEGGEMRWDTSTCLTHAVEMIVVASGLMHVARGRPDGRCCLCSGQNGERGRGRLAQALGPGTGLLAVAKYRQSRRLAVSSFWSLCFVHVPGCLARPIWHGASILVPPGRTAMRLVDMCSVLVTLWKMIIHSVGLGYYILR